MKIQNKIILATTAFVLAGLFSFKMLAEAWKINQKEAKISWTMPNGNKSGTVSGLDATIEFDPAAAENGLIKATVQVNTIDAGIEKLNAHLQTPDFFDAANHPTISFTAEKISKNDTGFVATGKLAMRDSIHTIDIPFKFEKGETQSTMKGTMDIFAGDYGIGKKSPAGNDRVIITIEVPMVKE